MVLDMSPIRRNHSDPAVDEGGDTDPTVGIERQRIEALKSADPGDQAAAMCRGPGMLFNDSRLDNVEGPQPRGLGFGDIERLFIG